MARTNKKRGVQLVQTRLVPSLHARFRSRVEAAGKQTGGYPVSEAAYLRHLIEKDCAPPAAKVKA